MIKLQKKVIYYIKKDYHHTAIIKNDSFYTVDDALDQFKKEKLKHYKNIKDISLFEEVELFIPTSYGMKKYYKKIDPELETIETNYKEED
jgi:hypothetical protein